MEERASRGPVIGVTCAPGSGKTSVAEAFVALGAKMVSLDAIGHELLRDGGVREEVRGTFSTGVFRVLDGEVSREKLAGVVFSDPDELEKLNRILHPRMVARVRSELERWRTDPDDETSGAFVIEGALLLEMKLDELCGRVVLVCAPREVRLSRLRRSRDWDELELVRRERAQMDENSRRTRADAVIENASSTDEMRLKVKSLWEGWK